MKKQNFSLILIVMVVVLVILNLFLLYYINNLPEPDLTQSPDLVFDGTADCTFTDEKDKDEAVEEKGFVDILDLRNTGNNLDRYKDEIKLTSPQPDQNVTNGFEIKGETTNWFFEGDFSYKLYSIDGFVITSGILKSQGDWMSPEFTGFTGMIEYKYVPDCKDAVLVLEKDNPGLKTCQMPTRLYLPVKLK